MKRFSTLLLSGSLFTAVSLGAESPEPKFRAVTIDDKIQIGYGVAVADVDGDRKPDVLLADKRQFVWYRNPGTEKAGDAAAWTKFVIAENLTEKDNVCLAAEDLDGDGKCELAVGAEWNPSDTEKSGAVFYLIPPQDRTQKWEPVKFPTVEPTTHRMRWLKSADGSWGLVVVPLHGRGNNNGVGAPVNVLVYKMPADPRSEWKSEVLNNSMHMTHNFDVSWGNWYLQAGREGIQRRPQRGGGNNSADITGNDGGQAQSTGVGEVRHGTFRYPKKNGDGTSGEGMRFVAAVEPMHGNFLTCYRPIFDNQNATGPWRRTVLSDQLTEGHALACGDLLGLGGDQIVVGWRGNPQKPRPVGIKLFTPVGSGEKWQEAAIDENGIACEDLVLADLNGDEKLDVIASGRSTRNVKIYLNETAK